MKTAVVILNYNGAALMEEFLPSVIHSVNGMDAEVIVADNASTDNSLEFLKTNHPKVRTIVLDKNYGFAEGYNRALAQIDAEYFVLLNSDVDVDAEWLKPLEFFMDNNPDVAACQPKILSQKNDKYFEYAGAAGGFIDKYGYPFCRGRLFNDVEPDVGQYDEQKDIFWSSGACLFIRKKDYEDVGGLDGDFFAHMEEIDLCWRLKNRGRRIVCIPSSVVYHVGGGTLAQGNPRKTFLNFRNNLLMLYKNLPSSRVNRILFIRMVLDGLAALAMLAKGDVENFKSVLKAHKDFKALKKKFVAKREKEVSFTDAVGTHAEIYRRSIVLAYYLRGIRKFRNLNWK